VKKGNLFEDAGPPREGERVDRLLTQRNLVVERIVSGASVPPGEYLPSQDEWVVLLKGDAVLTIAGETLKLESGDYVFLPAGVPHTLERVSEGALWLAVHLH
jgi:cupin 2 domain-containing protein